LVTSGDKTFLAIHGTGTDNETQNHREKIHKQELPPEKRTGANGKNLQKTQTNLNLSLKVNRRNQL